MSFPLDALGFSRNPLLRHSAERNGDLATRAGDDPAALTVVIAGEVPILRVANGAATSLLPLADLSRFGVAAEQAFLGTLGERPIFATLVEPGAAEAVKDDAAFRALDLRSIAVQGVVPAEEMGPLATAKALLHWHARHRFCAACGAPTVLSCAGFRRDCGACGTQHFPRTDPVVIMLVSRGDRCPQLIHSYWISPARGTGDRPLMCCTRGPTASWSWSRCPAGAAPGCARPATAVGRGSTATSPANGCRCSATRLAPSATSILAPSSSPGSPTTLRHQCPAASTRPAGRPADLTNAAI